MSHFAVPSNQIHVLPTPIFAPSDAVAIENFSTRNISPLISSMAP